MILSLYQEIIDNKNSSCIHNFYLDPHKEKIAYAHGNEKFRMTLYYNGKGYELGAMPKLIQRAEYEIEYPIASKRKKTFGYDIICNGNSIAQYYGEAACCQKVGIFKRNIGYTVFKFCEGTFVVYKVGFSTESSHYYCIYDSNNVMIGVIERHSGTKDGRKATVYIEDPKYLLVILIVCTEEIVSYANTTGRVDVDRNFHDRSAGNYISILKEEKDKFDRAFIERVKSIE